MEQKLIKFMKKKLHKLKNEMSSPVNPMDVIHARQGILKDKPMKNSSSIWWYEHN